MLYVAPRKKILGTGTAYAGNLKEAELKVFDLIGSESDSGFNRIWDCTSNPNSYVVHYPGK